MRVRAPAVAGRFYPGDPAQLAATVDAELAHAVTRAGAAPKALVVPHAGYVYSGPIAATGYATLRGARDTVHRVVLLGPTHTAYLDAIACSSADAFATPLGPIVIDTELRAQVLQIPGVVVDDHAHAAEHSLEVHLPFLQRALADFTLLPLVVGRVDPAVVADVLDTVWGGPETLIVVSTDLSHYLDQATATARDRATAEAIVNGRIDAVAADDACGATPVRGLLVAAARHGLPGELLDLRTSGDTAGDRSRVVGYGAFAFGSSTS